MSLRKGKLASKQWAPPKYIDEWQDDAKCAGMHNDMIPAHVCVGCPVVVQCKNLFVELDSFLLNGTQREQGMVGTYGGVEHPLTSQALGHEKLRTQIGECIVDECERGQARKHMCSMHYQRERTARLKGER